MRVALIGAGSVGTALAVHLQRAGYEIIGIASRTMASARQAADRVNAPYGEDPEKFSRKADIVFITTPDDVIADVCTHIAVRNGFSSGTVVVHTSGAHSSAILHSAEKKGAYPLSFHPLQTFANPEAGIENLPGSFITIEGHEKAIPAGRRLVEDLQCKRLEIPTEGKVLYHAAAVIACNYFVTLIDAALQTLDAAGISREDGLLALYPLIEGTLNNIRHAGTTHALTGPVARGDANTVRAHLDHMKKRFPAMVPLYTLLGEHTVKIAAVKGAMDAHLQQELLKLFGGGVK